MSLREINNDNKNLKGKRQEWDEIKGMFVGRSGNAYGTTHSHMSSIEKWNVYTSRLPIRIMNMHVHCSTDLR